VEKAHSRVGNREEKESSFGNRVTAGKDEVAQRPRLGAWRRREGGQGALSCRKGQGFVLTTHVQGDNCNTVEMARVSWGIREDRKRTRRNAE